MEAGRGACVKRVTLRDGHLVCMGWMTPAKYMNGMDMWRLRTDSTLSAFDRDGVYPVVRCGDDTLLIHEASSDEEDGK